MKIALQLVLAAILIAAGICLWTFLFPSPQQIIRTRLHEMARDVSYNSDQSSLAGFAAAKDLGGYFATNSEINLEYPGDPDFTLTGRNEIVQFDLRTRTVFNELKVDFPDLNVTVAPDQNSATADLTFRAQINGGQNSMAEEMKLTLQKIGGQWLITHIESVQVLT